MALHLIKVCVGVESISHLAALQKARRGPRGKASPHITRHMPKRAAEILDGGSMYWIVKGLVLVRQRIVGIDQVPSEDGLRCRLLLDKELVPTDPQPRRPHQGWRYLKPVDAPADLGAGGAGDVAAMPPEMLNELRRLGLL